MEKDIHVMRKMASKGIFESKYGSRERGATWQNMAENLSYCEEFALTARSLRDDLTTLMKSTSQKQDEKSKVPAQRVKSSLKISNFLKML